VAFASASGVDAILAVAASNGAVLPALGQSRSAVTRAGRHWHAHAAASFLDGYDDVARIEGLAGARAEMDGLLELFVLEKAVYELRYEVDNRPDWVRIPLAGLLDIVERQH
jgi:maltose alpha-D-glucosyltransferase/alpha-amylase